MHRAPSGKTSLASDLRDPRGILTSADGRRDSGLGHWGPLPVPSPYFVKHLRRFTSNPPKAKPRGKAVTPHRTVSSGNSEQAARLALQWEGRLVLTPSPGKLPRAQGTADARRAWGSWPGERVSTCTVAPASISPIQCPRGLAWAQRAVSGTRPPWGHTSRGGGWGRAGGRRAGHLWAENVRFRDDWRN